MIKYQHLLGRQWQHGSTDCYGIIRDLYHDNYDMELTNYARPDDWWDKGMNLYIDNFYAEGFRLVEEPIHKIQLGDILLVSVRSVVPCHAGVFVGDNQILHHYIGRLSEVVPLRGIFRDSVCAHVRHKDVVNVEETEIVNLLDLIPPHKRKQIEDALKSG